MYGLYKDGRLVKAHPHKITCVIEVIELKAVYECTDDFERGIKRFYGPMRWIDNHYSIQEIQK